MQNEQRRLAAIVAADVAGYSRLMGRDEAGTLAALKALRGELVDPAIAAHKGRIVKTTGDGLLLEFASVVDAVRCVLKVQTDMAARSALTPKDRRIDFRIGVHLGDIIIDDGDIFGDGVNIAARLEGIAEPGGICLSDDAWRQVRGKLEARFESLGPQSLKNIAHPVEAWRWSSGSPAAGTVAAVPLPLPDKPSIAVLPFQNMSGDPEQEYFADGMVEDIITALSRTKSLFVIARNSSFTYRDRAVDIKQVGRKLGVRYVLEGSVRKAGARLRVTGQLIEADTAMHVWADRFEGGLADIFELQDQVTSRVVGAIAPALQSAELERSQRKPTEDLRAYDFYLRGMFCLTKSTREATSEALELFHKALGLDPKFARAFAQAAYLCAYRKTYGWNIDLVNESVEAERLARRALELDRTDPLVLASAGWTLLYVAGRMEEGAALLDAALDLDPNLYVAWHWRGWAAVIRGEEKAIECFQRALRLSPLDPRLHSSLGGIATAHFLAGRYDEASSWATKAISQRPIKHLPTLSVAMASHALAGHMADARAIYEVYRQIEPDAKISDMKKWMLLPREEDYERYVQGFRLAGMPD